MKYNVVFFELDIELAKSMDDFLLKEIEKLDEAFPGVIYNKVRVDSKTKKYIPNSNRFVIRCANGGRIDLNFKCMEIYDENKAMKHSVRIKDKDKYAKLLSIINLGSTYYHAYNKHDLSREGIKRYDVDYKVDEIIINRLEKEGIEVLLTNCIRNFKYSKPEYMLDRVEIRDRVDTAWPSPDFNKHVTSLVEHKDKIDPNLYMVLYSLLTAPTINAQMLGEVIYKAVCPEYWKEYAEEDLEDISKRDVEERPVYTDKAKNASIDEINNLNICADKNIEQNVFISFDEFIKKDDRETDERPDVDSLIYENDDNENNKRRR